MLWWILSGIVTLITVFIVYKKYPKWFGVAVNVGDKIEESIDKQINKQH